MGVSGVSVSVFENIGYRFGISVYQLTTSGSGEETTAIKVITFSEEDD